MGSKFQKGTEKARSEREVADFTAVGLHFWVAGALLLFASIGFSADFPEQKYPRSSDYSSTYSSMQTLGNASAAASLMDSVDAPLEISFKKKKAMRRDTASLNSIPKSSNSGPSSFRVPETNVSYLQSTVLRKQENWSRDWLDEQTSLQWKSQVEAQILRSDRESQAGLLNAQEKRNQVEAMQGLSRSALNNLSGLFVRAQLNQLKNKAKGINSNIRDPLVVMIGLGSTLTGREVRLRATNWMVIRSRTQIQARTSRLSLQTGTLDTVLAYRDPGSDRTLSAQFLTRLDQNWSAGYDTSNNGTFRVNYGVSF